MSRVITDTHCLIYLTPLQLELKAVGSKILLKEPSAFHSSCNSQTGMLSDLQLNFEFVQPLRIQLSYL